MAAKIVVPELGESVIEATVGRWLKKEGDPVSVGDVVVELETDKVDLEVGAERAGVLARIERKQGQDVGRDLRAEQDRQRLMTRCASRRRSATKFSGEQQTCWNSPAPTVKRSWRVFQAAGTCTVNTPSNLLLWMPYGYETRSESIVNSE